MSFDLQGVSVQCCTVVARHSVKGGKRQLAGSHRLPSAVRPTWCRYAFAIRHEWQSGLAAIASFCKLACPVEELKVLYINLRRCQTPPTTLLYDCICV